MNIVDRVFRRAKFEYERLSFRPFVMTRRVDGLDIKVFINNLFAKHWYKNEHKWPELQWIKDHLLEPGDVVFDCGANSGYTSVYFSRVVGSEGKVLAFEPHPLNVEAIRKNIQINSVVNVEVIGKAVGNELGAVKLSKHPNGSISNLEKDFVMVDTVRLDDFAAANPTFLKIDVEGFELQVLQGAIEILKRRPKLDIEIHCALFERKIQTLEQIFALVNHEANHCWIQINVNAPIVPFDPRVHGFENMAKEEVVHLFTRPKETANY